MLTIYQGSRDLTIDDVRCRVTERHAIRRFVLDPLGIVERSPEAKNAIAIDTHVSRSPRAEGDRRPAA
jgi:hypothetical protein